MKVLIVDDELELLNAMRRSLRKHAHEWSLELGHGGAAALARLDAEPIDVIVSDLRMPGVDGLAVLEHVRRTQPWVVRILMSGGSSLHVDQLKAVSHLIWEKPMPHGFVPATLSRIAQIVAALPDRELRARVVALDPSVPAATLADYIALLADRVDTATIASALADLRRAS